MPGVDARFGDHDAGAGDGFARHGARGVPAAHGETRDLPPAGGECGRGVSRHDFGYRPAGAGGFGPKKPRGYARSVSFYPALTPAAAGPSSITRAPSRARTRSQTPLYAF